MWRPDFPYVRHAPGLALGHQRSLCVWSSAYRGSPERPGLVFGLDEAAEDTACRGIVFEVAPENRRQVIAYLFQRELIYPIYQPANVQTRSAIGDHHALTFTVDRHDIAYANRLTQMSGSQRSPVGAVGLGGRGIIWRTGWIGWRRWALVNRDCVQTWQLRTYCPMTLPFCSPSSTSRIVAVSMLCSSWRMNDFRSIPAGMISRNSSITVPCCLVKAFRCQ